MYSLLGVLLIGFSALSGTVLGLTLEERDKAIWAKSKFDKDTSIRKFLVEIPDAVVNDLKFRLNNTRKVVPPLNDVGFQYGFNSLILDDWVQYWMNKYNFTDRQSFFNQNEHFKTNIQGLDIHFMHIKPEVDTKCTTLPLLLLHGFPGSFREFYKTLPLLTTCRNGIALEVVVPSLPGFGYSDPATRTGMGHTEMATILRNLMRRLGFNTFYLQGGDWGSLIGTMMCTLYPNEILGFHTNFPVSFSPLTIALWAVGQFNTSLIVPEQYKSRMYPFLDTVRALVARTGYLHLQTTKPDTLGIAFENSPTGLLAYFLTMFAQSRGDSIKKVHGGLEDGVFTREELLDNIMIYWMNKKFTTAARIYAESFNSRNVQEALFLEPTPVPTWTLHARNEMIFQPKALLEFKFSNIVNSTVLDEFGHFLAFEQPQLFADNVITAITAFRNLASVSGKDEL